MTINRYLLLIFFCTLFCNVNAQSLPKIQKVGVRAPSNIKIDGKATEWNNKFQAYNNATDIFYTVSNDDENLFLIVQAKYHEVIDNILRGGLTLTVNHTLKKNDAEHVSITYPVFRDASMSDASNMLARKSNERKEMKDAPINVDDINKLLRDRSKMINIEGIKAISDASISVYNDDNIKVAFLFDTNLTYTYELAIPLKYIGLLNNDTPFSYQVKVNPPAEIRSLDHSAPPPPMMTTQLATTDFWGEYVLVKK